MYVFRVSFPLAATLFLASGMLSGCESNQGGSANVTSNYYGVGYYDPWYHGGYDDRDVIIVPPPRGNPPDNGLHPAHPIASPPPAPRPSLQPSPSIPSTPRPAPRPAVRR